MPNMLSVSLTKICMKQPRSSVLHHAVAIIQGATSKAPTAPLATGPRNLQLQHPLQEPTGLSPGSVQLIQQRGQGGCSTRNRTPNKCLSWLSRPFVPTISQRLMFDINRFFFFPDQPAPSESCSQATSILAAGLQHWSEKALTALGLLQAGCLSCEPQDPFPPAFP